MMSNLIMEKKREMICKNCGKEFNNYEELGKHAIKEMHYLFKLKGTELNLGVI